MGLAGSEDQDNADNIYADANLEIVINSRRKRKSKGRK